MSGSTSGITIRPMGDRAVLLDLAAATAAGGPTVPATVARGLRSEPGVPTGAGIVDVVPAASTVLVRFASGPGTRPPAPDMSDVLLARALGAVSAGQPHPASAPTVEVSTDDLIVPVRYDGPDLAEVAELTGLTVDEVVAAHSGTVWTAAFVGFAPGFAYLTGGDPRLQVPRRTQSRPSIPAGSVALAGEWSAVYPRESPGGWQLVGTTDLTLWDATAEPPARIRPGQRVRFVSSTHPIAVASVASSDKASATTAVDSGDGPVLVVVRPGPMALVQDAGRHGRAADGVGPSGPADRQAHARANGLVGNDPGAAAVECTLGGLTVRADGADLTVAVTGAVTPATVDGAAAPVEEPFTLPDGATLRLRAPRTGLRSYLAVRGTLDVATVLNSRSTDTLAGLGPTPLTAGSRLAVGDPGERSGVAGTAAAPMPPDVGTAVLPVCFGPRDDWFTEPTALLHGEWVVSPQSNRVALRLDRPADAAPDEVPPLTRSRTGELPSEGLVRGAIQVPPSGQPVLFLADHPLTGGYPVIAVVLDADVDRAGQLRPGQRLRFTTD